MGEWQPLRSASPDAVKASWFGDVRVLLCRASALPQDEVLDIEAEREAVAFVREDRLHLCPVSRRLDLDHSEVEPVDDIAKCRADSAWLRRSGELPRDLDRGRGASSSAIATLLRMRDVPRSGSRASTARAHRRDGHVSPTGSSRPHRSWFQCGSASSSRTRSTIPWPGSSRSHTRSHRWRERARH